ncbi:hypothetical protein [Deinococcus koreensis]|uniref:Phospholipase D-like domain-containing protein n=1 Tax=Deinococcus koreensis TaxID=2054903 RepID=A0A2K3UT13_9DEIO|nr:hypothetical protein [Deinococcus koreensis]PNY79675.1 hypothetical protein CVO96_17070 [Deinococcus koreensis]
MVLMPALVALTVCGGARAERSWTLTTSQQVGASLYEATSEVLLVTPTLRSKDVAEALRRAAVERGVRIFLIADGRYVNEGASYLASLSLTPGIQVRLVRGLEASRATIDRQMTVSGPLLADVPSPRRPGATLALQQPQAVRVASTWFSKAWATARPYRYQVPASPRRN